MTCPIQAHVSSVFVHVSDLKRSTEWYSRLLGLPIKPGRVDGGPIYWFDLDHQTGLILDDNRNNQADDKHPLFMFRSHDTKAAYEYVKNRGIPIKKEYYEDPAVSFFNFEDTDGNVIMVCGPSSAQEETGKANAGENAPSENVENTSSPIKSSIPNVFINVKDLKRATEWYSELLQLPIKPEEDGGFIYELRTTRGANILLDVNRYVQKQNYHTLFMFATDDIDTTHSFLQQQDIHIFTEIERYDTVSFLTFQDPDGNVLMVCQNK